MPGPVRHTTPRSRPIRSPDVLAKPPTTHSANTVYFLAALSHVNMLPVRRMMSANANRRPARVTQHERYLSKAKTAGKATPGTDHRKLYKSAQVVVGDQCVMLILPLYDAGAIA